MPHERYITISLAPREIARYRWLNLAFGAIHGCANLAVLLLLPLLIRFDILGFHLSWFLLGLPVALLSNGFWALQHEAFHNHFAATQATNKLCGRLMSILFGSSFRVLRFAHLMHHRFNRHPLDRPDTFDPDTTPAWRARGLFFAEILGGLYLIEIISPLLYCLPQQAVRRLLDRIYAGEDSRLTQLRQLAQQTLGSSRAIAEVRQDVVAVLLLYGLAFGLWGGWWWGLLAFILIRAVLISFLDNVYHFRTPVDRPDFAYNLCLSTPLRALIFNMNFHRIHHHHMHLPWWALPRQFQLSGETFDQGYFHAAIAQFRGPAPTGMLGSD